MFVLIQPGRSSLRLVYTCKVRVLSRNQSLSNMLTVTVGHNYYFPCTVLVYLQNSVRAEFTINLHWKYLILTILMRLICMVQYIQNQDDGEANMMNEDEG